MPPLTALSTQLTLYPYTRPLPDQIYMEQKEFEHIANNLRMTALHAARRIVGEADAEDIAGDTMLKLWGVHDDISGGKSEAARLAYIMAYHAAIDLCRQRDSRHTIRIDCVEERIGAADETRPDRMLEGEESMEWIMERIRRLPPREMQVLIMRQREHRSNSEIAAIMGIAEHSVATMLSAARRRLFDELKRKGRATT